MSGMAEASKIRPSQFRSWLQLMRIANLPTAISNVMAGYILAGEYSTRVRMFICYPIPNLIVLLLFSALIYCGGMIQNDAFDTEIDAVDRPHRPIPSGRIGRRTAFIAAAFMLALPITCLLAECAIAMVWHRVPISSSKLFRALPLVLVFAGLPILITLYNGRLKKTFFAPALMGSCRTLNLLLGGAAGFIFRVSSNGVAINDRLVCFAVFVGIFVAGITLFARTETAHRQSRIKLSLGAAVMLAGLLLIASLPIYTSARDIRRYSPVPEVSQAYFTFIAMISIPIVRRLWIAIRDTSPASVGAAIVTSLSSLIFLDAAVCFLEHPAKPFYAGAVALLIIPVIILRKFSAQT